VYISVYRGVCRARLDAFDDAIKAAAELGAELHRTTNQLPHVLKSVGKLAYCLTGEEIMLKTNLYETIALIVNFLTDSLHNVYIEKINGAINHAFPVSPMPH